MTTSLSAQYSRRRDLIDFAIRATLSLCFVVVAGSCLRNDIDLFHKFDPAHPDPKLIGDAAATAAIGLYSIVISSLYAVRLRAISAYAGPLPSAAAILGGFLLFGLLFLPPRDDLSLTVQMIACSLVTIGNILTMLCLLRLGKSFSILPESRRLVTTGPYRFVRHPVYLAEAISALGVVIHVLSVWAVLIVIAQFAMQILRMHYEEKVLRKSFPEYEDYARKTARLIPGIY